MKKRCRSKSVVRARKRREGLSISARQDAEERHSFPSFPRSVSTFERFVENQGLLDSTELPSFFGSLRRPLPTCFRIRGDNNYEAVQRGWQQLVQDFRLDAWQPGIPGAWQLQPDGNFFDGMPPPVRAWLARNTKTGAISRQELVSMLPVALLQVESHHAVLDLCASPGSKTVQAVDDLYANHCEARNTSSIPTGFVVANELDARRSHILAHRARQSLGHRHVSLAIVCHNATKFPNVQAPLVRQPPSSASYDRIICDVPCSGDGTLRKDFKVWKTWHPSYGIALHQLQIRIAKRGIALLKLGGLMTYSTCSFHPVEDEAVVAALLRTGCVEVVPPDTRIPNSLRWRQGRSYWKVLNDECDEVSEAEAPSNWPATLWHRPEEMDIKNQLQHCVRLFPQDNDTGGFFIALLRKIKDFEPRKRVPMRPPLLTPVPKHHLLHKFSDESLDAQKDVLHFLRSPSNAESPVFSISRSLAHHLVDTPGSAKLNIVSAGHKS